MTIVALGVFALILAGLTVTIAGLATRTRLVVAIGLLVLLTGVALFFGIRSACGGVDSGC